MVNVICLSENENTNLNVKSVPSQLFSPPQTVNKSNKLNTIPTFQLRQNNNNTDALTSFLLEYDFKF